MRIAIVGSTQAIVGGAEVYQRWVLADLAARGHTLAFAFDYPAKEADRAADLGVDGLVRICIGELGREAFLMELERFAPDLVYLHCTSDAEVDAALARRFRCVIFAHAYYGTCATGTRTHQFPGVEICERRFGGACLPLNYARSCGIRRPADLLRSYNRQQRRIDALYSARAVVVASDYVRDLFERQGVSAQRLHVIPYPVVGAEPDPSPPQSRPFTNRVVFLGRLTHLKGLAHAVAALARASARLGRQLSLDVGGEGPELDRCRDLARHRSVEARFWGWVDDARREQLIREADAIIVPSLWPEPFGMVGLEAGCFGVPAVAYSVGGIPEWLDSGVSGELVASGALDPDALGDALARALDSPSRHQTLREGAWRATARFSREAHAEKLRALFDAVVPSPRGKVA
jgi:glycosyltransferase involved in cell wall biosynthesis